MLVVSRKLDEKLYLGNAGDVLTGPIVVTVVDIRGDNARIGVDAQDNVSIDREEVWVSKRQIELGANHETDTRGVGTAEVSAKHGADAS